MEIDNNNFVKIINDIFQNNEICKIIISNPCKKDYEYKKIVLENKTDHFMQNAYTQKQSFTKNLNSNEVINELCDISKYFKQYNFFSAELEYMIKFSKSGKLFLTKNKIKRSIEIKSNNSNNRIKNYIFKDGEIIPPLIDMGIYSQEGKIINSMYDKYKQINRFIELIDDYIKNNNLSDINIIDFGCGKSYLTFIVYYYFKFVKKININMIGLDLKEDVIKKCNKAAKKYGYDTLKFELGDINGYKPKMKVDMIMTLHACDTATDYALYNAINWNVKMIFSVPCCQHEINKQISTKTLPIITRYGLIKERISSDFTDIVRCNLLKTMDYNVEMIEFIGFEHTPKNILIRANLTKIPFSIKKQYLKEVLELKNTFQFEQTLLNLLNNKLREQGLISD